MGYHGQVGVQDFRSAWLELINVGICGLMNKAISAQYLYYICTFAWALTRNIRNRSKPRCYAKNLTTIKHCLRTSIIIQTLAKHTTVHCSIPGSKFTFSTNLFHHSLLSPAWTAFTDYTRPDLLCSTVFRLDALALSVIATATWLAGWLSPSGIASKPLNLSENFFDHLKAPSF